LLKYRYVSFAAPATTAKAIMNVMVAVPTGQAIDFTIRAALDGAAAQTGIGLNVPDPLYSGTMDFKALFADLISHSVVTGNEYLGGIEFGAEPSNGAGGMTVNSYAVTWQ
jgi:hypothetical protein